jgi:hypothetical protein
VRHDVEQPTLSSLTDRWHTRDWDGEQIAVTHDAKPAGALRD